MEKETFYDTIIICFIVIIGIGLFQACEFQQKSVHPLESAIDNVDGILIASDSQAILSYLELIKQNVPKEGNPVFIYPSGNTDYAKMQEHLDLMITKIVKISNVQRDSSSFHVGVSEVKDRVLYLRESLMDAKASLYSSPPNVFFTAILLVGTLGLVETFIRKTEPLY